MGFTQTVLVLDACHMDHNGKKALGIQCLLLFYSSVNALASVANNVFGYADTGNTLSW